MSILLARLLRQAEASLAAGEAEQAETLCSQVLGGAATVRNIALACDAASLLRRIPVAESGQRRAALFELGNFIAALQTGSDREGALKLCDALLELSDELIYEKLNALELALYISGSLGMCRERHPSYDRYLEHLIALERQPARGGGGDHEPALEAGTPPQALTELLAERGAVLVRRLLRDEQLSRWRDAAAPLFAAENTQTLLLSRLGDPGSLLDAQQQAYLVAALQPFFYFTPKLCADNCFVRKVSPDRRETAVPFHQDVNAFGRLMVNVWIPLVACGREAPGLEVVAQRTPLQLEVSSAASQYDALQIPEELIRERFGAAAIFSPEMQPGDVLVLLGTTVHRTRIAPGMSRDRLSIEFRFAGK